MFCESHVFCYVEEYRLITSNKDDHHNNITIAWFTGSGGIAQNRYLVEDGRGDIMVNEEDWTMDEGIVGAGSVVADHQL